MIKSEAFSSELTGHVSPQHPPSPPKKEQKTQPSKNGSCFLNYFPVLQYPGI